MFFRKHDRIWGLGSTKNSEKWCASFSKSVLKRWISVKKTIFFGFTNFETFTLELSAQHDCEWLYKTRNWNFGQILSTMPTTFANKVIHQTRKTSLLSREKNRWISFVRLTWGYHNVPFPSGLMTLSKNLGVKGCNRIFYGFFSRKNWKWMFFGPSQTSRLNQRF